MVANATQPNTQIVYQYFIALVQHDTGTLGGVEAISWNGVRSTNRYRTFKYDTGVGPNSLEIDEVYPGHVAYTGTIKGISVYNQISFLENFIRTDAGIHGFDILRQIKPFDIDVNIYKANSIETPAWVITLSGVVIQKVDIEFDITADDPKIVQELPFAFKKLSIAGNSAIYTV